MSVAAAGRDARTSAIMVVVALVAFVTALDTTIVAAAAPSIGRDLGLGLGWLQWVGVAYTLPYAGLLLAAGFVLDGLGRRRVLVAGCAVFAAACLAGGVARSAETLLGARVTQGVAAAVIVPAVISLIRTELPPSRRPVAMGVWTGALATALALGPWLGGVLAEHLHWSWIFLCNVPFVVGAGALVARTVGSDSRRSPVPLRRLVGLAPAVTGAVLLAAAVMTAGGPAASAILAGAGIAGLLVFVAIERHTTHPLVPVRLRADRVFAGAVGLVVLWGLGVSGIVFFTPLVYQDYLGFGPQAAGLPLVVVAAGVIVTTPFVPLVTRLLGPHRAVCLGLLVLAAGLVALAVVNKETTLAPRLGGLALAGIGSAVTAPITSQALDRAGPAESAIASSLLTASRELSAALGIGLIGLVLASVRAAEIGAGTAGGPALASGYTVALLVAAALQVAGAVLALVVLRPGPAVSTGSEETWSTTRTRRS